MSVTWTSSFDSSKNIQDMVYLSIGIDLIKTKYYIEKIGRISAYRWLFSWFIQ